MEKGEGGKQISTSNKKYTFHSRLREDQRTRTARRKQECILDILTFVQTIKLQATAKEVCMQGSKETEHRGKQVEGR